MMELKLYDKIFDVANGKMQEHGLEFCFGREAFQCILHKNPNVISVEEFMELGAKDFVDAVYLRCLNRLPNSFAYNQMKKYSQDLASDLLLKKYILLMNVNRSAEFKTMHKRIEGVEWLRKEVIKNGTGKTRLRLMDAECKAGIKYVLKKYFISPIWNRLSLDRKMAIKAFVLREK